jgi:HEAT repeat protein
MPIVRKTGGAPPAAATVNGVVEGLSSPSEEVRWTAARAAAGMARCAAPLSAALRVEPVARVREAMFTSLAGMGHAGAAGVLPLLRSDDANLRTGALDALKILIRSAPDVLPPLLEDADADVRILSCELARMLPGDEATRLLCRLLRDEQQPNVCAAAVDVLAEVGQSEALPVLAACAARFHDAPFLAFAIQVATDRISVQPTLPRG